VRARLTWTMVLSAVVAVLVASTSAVASPVDLLPPTVETTLSGGPSPATLPTRERVPVSLRLAETVRTPDGSHPPALQDLRMDLDRHLGLSVKGVPRCPRYPGGRQSREKPYERCEDAKVGSGTVELEVAFPEQMPVEISGELSVYNGGFREGRTMFWLFVYLPAPVTGGILMPLEIRRGGHGPYGWVGELEIPKIGNGAGSITYLGARFSKGVFSANCAGGRLLTGARSRFADGSAVSSTLIRDCRPS
jgi:hypothetical protein